MSQLVLHRSSRSKIRRPNGIVINPVIARIEGPRDDVLTMFGRERHRCDAVATRRRADARVPHAKAPEAFALGAVAGAREVARPVRRPSDEECLEGGQVLGDDGANTLTNGLAVVDSDGSAIVAYLRRPPIRAWDRQGETVCGSVPRVECEFGRFSTNAAGVPPRGVRSSPGPGLRLSVGLLTICRSGINLKVCRSRHARCVRSKRAKPASSAEGPGAEVE
jgi:hypothetical protein